MPSMLMQFETADTICSLLFAETLVGENISPFQETSYFLLVDLSGLFRYVSTDLELFCSKCG
jgi:hypothetical protein